MDPQITQFFAWVGITCAGLAGGWLLSRILIRFDSFGRRIRNLERDVERVEDAMDRINERLRNPNP